MHNSVSFYNSLGQIRKPTQPIKSSRVVFFLFAGSFAGNYWTKQSLTKNVSPTKSHQTIIISQSVDKQTSYTMVEQNLAYAYGLAAVGGCMQVMAILVLAYPHYQKTVHNVKYSDSFESLLVPMNIVLQILLGFVNTASTWYGPVSIVIPVRVSAQLLFNMFFFGGLGIENFTKDVKVGTYIVVLGALLLPIVGPTAQEGQDAVQLFEHMPAETWTAILVVLTTTSGFYCIKWIGDKNTNGTVKHAYKFHILLTARVASAVLSTSLSKFLVGTSGLSFGITVFGYMACSIVISSVAILQATETDQMMFVPASACGIQFMNAITGLVIWQDYLVVQSWPTYFTVIMQIVLGVYLISSLDEYPSSSVETNYALVQSVKIQIGKQIARHRGTSIVSHTGGVVDSLKTIKEEEATQATEVTDEKPVHITFNSDSLKSSIRSSFRPPPGITESERSMFSYGTIDSAMKFTESFEV